ncbi:hypothetical protein HYH03_018239 [Edaphochlamys debaryana]|uniref:GH16 domain-containing protein n=1 Tax=Edaphochlamys debaryana TaxID=47281 RepID=A0A836BPQ8_9CHLO|nr:hypothetical protein HYH03_018239 [Edaphochlamys debaryana]|eukprot:KAG2482848.1 hypothetical protein HYH03_018239 [Edaphochlamys debaryana]
MQPALNNTGTWIDKDTPASACTKNICTTDYYSCLGQAGWPSRWAGLQSGPAQRDDLVLVFSDEFDDPSRDFGPGKDFKWHALDLLYVNNDAAVFRNEAVTVRDGKLVLTATRERKRAPMSSLYGDFLSDEQPYTSGAVQGWNKFCFTGGYMEVSVKLPGDDKVGGFWPSVFTLGNLGRTGYLRSSEGLWPHSYNTCDTLATEKKPNWSDNPQRINRCNSPEGRGAPEIDLLEAGVWKKEDGKGGYYMQAEVSTSLPISPILPNGLHWLDDPESMKFATYNDPYLQSKPNPWNGPLSYSTGVNADGTPKWHNRPGNYLSDYLSGIHHLNSSYFTSFQRWGLDWQPGEYIRWYINDVLIQGGTGHKAGGEVNKKALVARTNGANESIGERFIPLEPSYINIFLAMADNFAPIDHENLVLPASMEVDYVRIWQRRDRINIGCSPPDFPTQEYINANRDFYLVSGVPGFTDFVGDSSVVGPMPSLGLWLLTALGALALWRLQPL